MAFINESRSIAGLADKFAEGVDMGGSRKKAIIRVVIVALSALTETSLTETTTIRSADGFVPLN
jgi:hypothetical protein